MHQQARHWLLPVLPDQRHVARALRAQVHADADGATRTCCTLTGTTHTHTSIYNAPSLTDRNLFVCGTICTDRGAPKELLDSVYERALAKNELRFYMAPTTKLNQPLSVVVFCNSCASGFYVLPNVHEPTETEVIHRRTKAYCRSLALGCSRCCG